LKKILYLYGTLKEGGMTPGGMTPGFPCRPKNEIGNCGGKAKANQ